MLTLELVSRLSRQSGRAEAAAALAAHLGVDAVLLFVRDPSLGAFIPAPGMRQTLRGGKSLREFIAGCPERGRCSGTVELPRDTHRSALALVLDGTAVVLVGGTPVESAVLELERLLELLAGLLAAEQAVVVARGEALAAMEAASRAEVLTRALEAARADASLLNAELREEHRRKDEFLAMLGHELRNPLSPLVTSIELLRKQGAEKPVPVGLVDIMARQTAQLSRLIDDLLDVSRVSRGKIDLKRASLELGVIVTEALEESRVSIEANRHRVAVHGADLPLPVYGDRARLVQVFGNLLNNAAKYTDPEGTITISLIRRDPNAIVRVSDTGIGIPADMQPRIFELFAQTPDAIGRAQGGLGIGLTLVRTLVELHGGQVTVESAGPRCGSTFSVELPLVAGHPQRQPVAPKAETLPNEKALEVLVVDDNRDAADSVAILLRLMGHRVEVAYDGKTALCSRAGSRADLVLLDIGMPDLDGYQLARELRKSAKRGARFVALTGYGTEEGRRRSREAGFDEHLIKPISGETLEALVSATARQR